MRIYLNDGNDIKNAAQMVDAMRSSGGVSGLYVTLCEMENPRTSTNVKFDGVSRVSNVEYGEDCITTSKAYGIGPGKTVKLSKFTRSNNETPILRLSRCVEDVVVARTHDLEHTAPILGICNGVFTDRSIFRLSFPEKTKAVPVR